MVTHLKLDYQGFSTSVDRHWRNKYHASMEKLVSTHVMERVDLDSQQIYSVPALILMEQAGVRGWQALVEASKVPLHKEISLLFVAGGGNNGGDALVMARQAAADGFINLQILLVASRFSSLCSTQKAVVTSLGLSLYRSEKLLDQVDDQSLALISEADIIIDGLSGTGLKGPLQGLPAQIVEVINAQKERGCAIWAIDIPSGCADNLSSQSIHIQADQTVTMGLQKYSAYHPPLRAAWGKILCVNPTFPPQVLRDAPATALLCQSEDATLKPLGEASFKHKRGHLALFAGSYNYSGAARLASRAAFHARVGLVTLCCDQEIVPLVASESPSVIIQGLFRQEVLPAAQLEQKFQAIVAGPGWASHHEGQLIEILKSKIPAILDAQAIALFASAIASGRLEPKQHGPLVLTPHPGELRHFLERLAMPLLAQETSSTGSAESFVESMQKVAEIVDAYIIYRSHVIWIFPPHPNSLPMVIDGMNAALGVAGSGDVFVGILGSLLAQQYDVSQATVTAALIHQKSGLLGRNQHGWFDSEELIEQVGHACNFLESQN